MFFFLFLLDDRRKIQKHMDPTDPDTDQDPHHWETLLYTGYCSFRQVDVEKYVKALPRRQETSDMTPQLIEEYILETAERGQARVYHTRYRRQGLSYQVQETGSNIPGTGARVYHTRYRRQGLSYQVQETGSIIPGTGDRVYHTRYRRQGLSYQVQETGSNIQGTGARVYHTRYRSQGLTYQVQKPGSIIPGTGARV
jgi:hypothetical protein